MKSDYSRTSPAVRVRVFFLEPGGNRRRLTSSLSETHPRFETADCAHEMRAAIFQGRCDERMQRRQVGAFCTYREFKTRRHHSDDDVGIERETDLPADDVAIAAKVTLPPFVSEHDKARPRFVFRGGPDPTEHWSHAKNLEDL